MQIKDTIAAISSGLTQSGIGIVRISGPDSFSIASHMFRKKNGDMLTPEKLSEPGRFRYGFITDKSGRNIDEVLMLSMKAPHSYTGEDVIEVDCHGGALVMKLILAAFLDQGARPAEPGEFTKRAFLNGRIDLAQAESVISLIEAKSERAASASLSQLNGRLSDTIKTLRKEILHETARIESALDDPEHYSLDGYPDILSDLTRKWISGIDRMIDTFNYGRILSEGIRTVITGRPNAGKSSLLNALLGKERAIVTKVPGTTRDTISENLSCGGLSLNIVDTAGIRETGDVVEQQGVERALSASKDADLVLFVVDLSVAAGRDDIIIAKHIKDYGRKTILVLNKNDLKKQLCDDDIKNISDILGNLLCGTVSISASKAEGTQELLSCISGLFENKEVELNDELIISSMRHLEALKAAESSLMLVRNSASDGLPEDFYTIDLYDAYTCLGYIIGEAVDDDLVNEIFSAFCMGK